MFIEFNKIYDKVKNRMFIVNAPIALRDTELDHNTGIYGHGGSKYDPNRRTNFGMNIISMAKAYRDGLGFTLYDKDDLKDLVDIMNEYVIRTSTSRRAINFRRFDTEEVSMVYDFGVNVVELNRDMRLDPNKEIKRALGAAGSINPVEILDKINSKKQSATSSHKQRSSKIIKRPKPLEF